MVKGKSNSYGKEEVERGKKQNRTEIGDKNPERGLIRLRRYEVDPALI